MLTLRQVLQLPSFSNCKFLTGQNNLDGSIKRVRVVSSGGLTYFGAPGDLLIIDNFEFGFEGLEEDESASSSAGDRAAGIVFLEGKQSSIPDEFLKKADQLNIPVIQLPTELDIHNTATRLENEIKNHELEIIERTEKIRRELTRLTLEGTDLAVLANTLSRNLGRSILIVNSAFKILASGEAGLIDEAGSIDEARRKAIISGATTPEVIEGLAGRGLYSDLRNKKQLIRLDPIPDLGMTMERLVAPIFFEDGLYGTVWLLGNNSPFSMLDELIGEHFAAMTALNLLQKEVVRESEREPYGEFLEQLLQWDGQDDRLLLERACQIGYRFNEPHQVLFVIGRFAIEESIGQLVSHLRTILQRQNRWSLVVKREPGIAILIETGLEEVGREVATNLLKEVSRSPIALIVGMSNPYRDISSFPDAFYQAQEAAEIGWRLDPRPEMIRFDELGLMDWLYHLPSKVIQSNLYYQRILFLKDHDQRTKNDLVKTLEAYLENEGSLTQISNDLHVHPNTLLYRLKKIEELINVNLKQGRERLNLYSALVASQLADR